MGEYIRHKSAQDEIKLGVYRKETIECFYPKWVLEKFLESGYENKSTIQNFLKDWDKVVCQDYKKYGSEKLYEVYVNGWGCARIDKIRSEWAAEGNIVQIVHGSRLICVANEYTKQLLLAEEEMRKVKLMFKDYDPNEISTEQKFEDFVQNAQQNGYLPF